MLLTSIACGDRAEPSADVPSPATPAVLSVDTTQPARATSDSMVAQARGQPPADTPASAAPNRPAPSDTASPAPAERPQQDPAAAILRRASAAYTALRSMRADFVMEVRNPLLRRTTTSRGTWYQRAPDRILLRFTDPEGDVIVGDGTYFWVYYPSVNPDQVMRAPAADAGSDGVDLRAQFIGEPAERFAYRLEGTESVGGRAARVLLLEPKGEAGYRSLKVWIDDADAIARRFEIVEHNGVTRAFALSALAKNPTLEDDLFRFTPPQGVRIVSPPGGVN